MRAVRLYSSYYIFILYQKLSESASVIGLRSRCLDHDITGGDNISRRTWDMQTSSR